MGQGTGSGSGISAILHNRPSFLSSVPESQFRLISLDFFKFFLGFYVLKSSERSADVPDLQRLFRIFSLASCERTTIQERISGTEVWRIADYNPGTP